MKIGVPKEERPYEARVAAVPDSVKRYKALGLEPVVEAGAGVGAAVLDDAYTAAGAALGDPWSAEILLKVQRPTEAEMAKGFGALSKAAKAPTALDERRVHGKALLKVR